MVALIIAEDPDFLVIETMRELAGLVEAKRKVNLQGSSAINQASALRRSRTSKSSISRLTRDDGLKNFFGMLGGLGEGGDVAGFEIWRGDEPHFSVTGNEARQPARGIGESELVK